MMKEENILNEKFGKANHFTVPGGYFDSFADKLMEQLPEEDTHIIDMRTEAWWHRLPLHKIAAVVGVAVVMGGGVLGFTKLESRGHVQMAHADQEQVQGGESSYGTFEEVADYAMMDNQDIYASLVAEN